MRVRFSPALSVRTSVALMLALGLGSHVAFAALTDTAPTPATATAPAPTPDPVAIARANDLSSAFKTAARTVRDSVVSIKAVKGMPGGVRRGNRFMGQPQSIGTGSGVIVSADGYVITNNHVAADAISLTVHLSDNSEHPARLVGADPLTDLAVLKIDATVKPATIGDSDAMEVGDWVIAVGSPFGLDQTVTAGIVSAKGRSLNGNASFDEAPIQDFIQTDAAINPGNSGGPLINLNGEVIGINSAIISSQGGGSLGIGLSIPSGIVRSVFESIRDTGRFERGLLGVTLADLNSEVAESLGSHAASGVVLAYVQPQGPADRAGLRSEDIITRFGTRSIGNIQQLRAAVAAARPGAEVEAEYIRKGQSATTKIRVGSRDELDRLFAAAPVPAEAAGDFEGESIRGMTVGDITETMARRMGINPNIGVLVASVQRGSPAARVGIQPGMVIARIGAMDVHSVKDAREAVKSVDPDRGLRVLIVTDAGLQFAILPAR